MAKELAPSRLLGKLCEVAGIDPDRVEQLCFERRSNGSTVIVLTIPVNPQEVDDKVFEEVTNG